MYEHLEDVWMHENLSDSIFQSVNDIYSSKRDKISCTFLLLRCHESPLSMLAMHRSRIP